LSTINISMLTALYTLKNEISETNANYGFEPNEDPADYVRINTKAVRLA
jgi:hypothetical protein